MKLDAQALFAQGVTEVDIQKLKESLEGSGLPQDQIDNIVESLQQITMQETTQTGPINTMQQSKPALVPGQGLTQMGKRITINDVEEAVRICASEFIEAGDEEDVIEDKVEELMNERGMDPVEAKKLAEKEVKGQAADWGYYMDRIQQLSFDIGEKGAEIETLKQELEYLKERLEEKDNEIDQLKDRLESYE